MLSVWSSWAEYVSHVHPTAVVSEGGLKAALLQSAFKNLSLFLHSKRDLETALGDLSGHGFAEADVVFRKYAGAELENAYRAALNLIRAGEELLLFSRRLAESPAAYGFLHANQLPTQWERHKKEGNPVWEIAQLTQDGKELYRGLMQLEEQDDDLFMRGLQLPRELQSDFRLSRDLFSVGFEEPGLFSASKGLERVLRTLAQKRRLVISSKRE